MLMQPQSGGLILAGFAVAVAALVWWMRRLSMRGRFLVLLILAVSIGFVFMTVVQVPEFPHWLALALVLVVFMASPFAVRSFMVALRQEEEVSSGEAPR
jgi:hypothetical protein